jgi:hypothetical protein
LRAGRLPAEIRGLGGSDRNTTTLQPTMSAGSTMKAMMKRASQNPKAPIPLYRLPGRFRSTAPGPKATDTLAALTGDHRLDPSTPEDTASLPQAIPNIQALISRP